MKTALALGSGLTGALLLTAIHETVRKISPKAPRMDLLGMQALSKMLRNMNRDNPGREKLFWWAMAGDVVSNALYYSLAGAGSHKGVWLRGTLLGAAAGLGAVLLPKYLHLNEEYSNRTIPTKIMTIALYLAGGLIASTAAQLLQKRKGAQL